MAIGKPVGGHAALSGNARMTGATCVLFLTRSFWYQLNSIAGVGVVR